MKRILSQLDLVAFYIYEVFKSNFVVARDVLGNQRRLKPGIVVLKIGELSDFQAFILANLVTMTPGTLSIQISPEKRSLVLHTLYTQDLVALQSQITDDYERRIRNAF